MKTELFGVFGGPERFDSFRPTEAFGRVVSGPVLTVGVRDAALGQPGRTDVYEGPDGMVVVWGEAYPPDDVAQPAAEWLYKAVSVHGTRTLSVLNGSYVAAIDVGDLTLVAGDPIRSWEVFHSDVAGTRVFGTDAAAVARTIHDPTIDPLPVYEFLVLGGALNDNTLLAELDRLPLDRGLIPGGTVDLGRYVHEPQEFDYARSLARRLERAIERRADLPGRKGALLSAGLDSRVLLHRLPDIQSTYTLGRRDSSETQVAREIARKNGTEHTQFEPDERYLTRDGNRAEYTNGVKESLHIHHVGYDAAIDVDSIYHGLLWDTVLRGYFQPRNHVEVLDLTFPRRGVDPDPDPVSHLAGILGYLPGSDPLIQASDLDAVTGEEFFQETIAPAFEACSDRSPSVYAALERFGMQNVLSSPFRTHLADNYVEGLVAADRELIDWHLHTPPEVRTERTFRNALEHIDSDLLDPRPPDRPHDSFLGNQVEKRLRNSLPGLESFDAPWPDRRRLYRENGMDEQILPNRPDLHGLPPRVKLRIDDLRQWLELATDGAVSVDPLLPQLDATRLRTEPA